MYHHLADEPNELFPGPRPVVGCEQLLGIHFRRLSLNIQFKNLKSKNSSMGALSIRTLVRECDVRWNSIEASLLLFYRKMTDLGFTFDGSDVICPNEGEALNV